MAKKTKAYRSRLPSGEVFVSYAHADRERVRPIVKCLRAAGLNVWWDEGIDPGSVWGSVIEQKLREAACVMVVWSHASVESIFVRAEAREALDRYALERSGELAILQGVKIDKVRRLPLPFGELQFTDLTDWTDESCRTLKPLIAAARALTARVKRHNYGATLASDGPVTDARSAATRLRQVTKRIGSLKELANADSDAMSDLRGSLDEVHKTYTAVVDGIDAFVAPAFSDSDIDGKPYAKMERGSLKKQIRDGRGHCHLIYNHYGRQGGLRQWLEANASAATLEKADRAFAELSTADDDLFDALLRIGDVLTNESRAIVNLVLTKQQAAASKRIVRGRKKLASLENELDRGISDLQKVEQRLGIARSQ